MAFDTVKKLLFWIVFKFVVHSTFYFKVNNICFTKIDHAVLEIFDF